MHWWRRDVNVQNPSAGRRASGNIRTRSYYSTEKGEIFTNFNNQHGVRQSSLFSGKHPRSSINQEDQNVVLMILGENTCYFFPLGWQMLNSTFVSGANKTIGVGLCWPRTRAMALPAQHPEGGKGEEDTTQSMWKRQLREETGRPVKTGWGRL